MAAESKCSQCGADLPADAPQGLCPKCLMKLGMEASEGADTADSTARQADIPTSATPPGGFVPPVPAELAEKFPQLAR